MVSRGGRGFAHRRLLVGAGLVVLLASLGAAVLGVGHTAVLAVALPCGVALMIVGSLREPIRRLAAGTKGIEIETHDLEQIEASADLAANGGQDAGESDDNIDDILGTVRWLVASDVIERWLRHPSGALAGCSLHLYTFDEAEERLLPAFEPDDPVEPPEGWTLGVGVVGQAWATGELVICEGAACSDETYGLSREQQRRYQRRTAVAATPILNASSQAIAVLAASTSDPNTRLATEDGQDALLSLAEYVARILVDVLKWFTDYPPAAEGDSGGADAEDG